MPRRHIYSRLKNFLMIGFGLWLIKYFLIDDHNEDNNQHLDCSKLVFNVMNREYLKCIKSHGLKSIQMLTEYFSETRWENKGLGTLNVL
jgi:hypothetical protein